MHDEERVKDVTQEIFVAAFDEGNGPERPMGCRADPSGRVCLPITNVSGARNSQKQIDGIFVRSSLVRIGPHERACGRSERERER